MKISALAAIFYYLIFIGKSEAQSTTLKTANDYVPPYNGVFRYGSNMGYYAPFTDEQLADLASKVSVNSLRPAFYEFFGEQWGYDIRTNAFKHYGDLGMTENVCFIGYPSVEHRDKTVYCGRDTSALFANMYEPIWDKGENGTPVNDKNYYALYVYKVLKTYGKNVKYWEIWNEPDYATTFKPEMAPGLPGSWWNTNPDPCEYALHAPVQHYIRLLRVSYEVIKKLDPTAYVCVGGLGFPSFLDVILRQTDNPKDGSVTADFPLKGGAYFDVLSYHAYPHIDNSVREWSDKIRGFVHYRHSDRATEGVFKRKIKFEDVLKKYGYDGKKYPQKHFIITECNIPAKSMGEFMGSYEAQRNFLIKCLVKAQENGLLQFHVYSLGELTTEQGIRNEFDLMGLYTKLEGSKPTEVRPTQSGIAYKTTSQLLYGFKYDFKETELLKKGENIDGGAFKNPKSGEIIYCLWSKTNKDQSEATQAIFSFPEILKLNNLQRIEWDYAETKKAYPLSYRNIKLTGTPSFFKIKK